MTGVRPAIAASLAMAAISTAGDFIWATWIPEHRAVYGLIHGTVLFLSLGLVLGVVTGRPLGGALGGAAVGALGAGAYYVLSPFVGFSAMLVVWFGVWVALTAVYARLNGTRMVAGRAVLAAIASALAFYAISGIWRPFNPQGWDYAVHFAAWTAAFLPGFAALMIAKR